MTVRVELPGVQPKDVILHITDDILTLSGEKRMESPVHEENLYRQERCFGAFRRILQLPTFADPERATAEYANGVLTIRIPKSEGTQSKRVPIAAK